MEITFWGARGSVPVSGPEFTRHGGATTCVEITLPNPQGDTPQRLIIDCGTGLTELGKRWAQRDPHALILQTHFHWDHIQGFPFFAPLFNPRGDFELLSVERDGCGLRDVLASQMRRPTFPVGLDILPAHLTFHKLPPHGALQRGDLTLTWAEVHHPSGCTAWRCDYQGTSLVFSGDIEVQLGGRDELIQLAHGADLLIMDAQYTPEEYPAKRSFGHSTWQDAVEVATAAGVSHLVLTHHDPTHCDERLDRKLHDARRAAPHLTLDNAAEQRTLHLQPRSAPRRRPHQDASPDALA